MSPKTGTARQKATAGVVEALASSPDLDEALARAAAAIAAAEDASTVQIWGKDPSGSIVCRAAWAKEAGDFPLDIERVGATADLAQRPDLLAVLDGAELIDWKAGASLPDDVVGLLVAFFASRLSTLAVRAQDETVGALTVVQDGPAARSAAAQRNRLVRFAQLLSAPLHPDGGAQAEEAADVAASRDVVLKGQKATAKPPRARSRKGKTAGAAETLPARQVEAAVEAEGAVEAEAAVEAAIDVSELAPLPAAKADEAPSPRGEPARDTDRAEQATARQVEALRDAAQAVVTILDADQAVEAVKGHIATLLGGRECRVRVFLLTPQGGYAEFPPRPETLDSGDDAAQGPADLERRAIADGTTLTAVTSGAMRLATPIQLRGAPLGYLTLIAGRTAALTPAETAAVETMAQQVCLALDLARLRRAVQGLTTVDTLTGLRNREFLFERLAAEIARGRRYGEPLSLIRMDLDDFTAFNAAHGNREGNRLLRTTANLTKMSIREDVDVVCRFAGGEFAILLPNTLAAAGAAGIVAERLRSTVDTTQFHDDYDNRLGHVTVSLGVAGFPAHAEEADDLVNLAGEALRAAKAAGKNKVGLYSQRS